MLDPQLLSYPWWHLVLPAGIAGAQEGDGEGRVKNTCI